MPKSAPQSKREMTYIISIYNGRVKIHIDGSLFVTFSQLDFRGLYAYKDDTNVYGVDIYLINGQGRHTMEVYFKTRAAWLKTLELLDSVL